MAMVVERTASDNGTVKLCACVGPRPTVGPRRRRNVHWRTAGRRALLHGVGRISIRILSLVLFELGQKRNTEKKIKEERRTRKQREIVQLGGAH